MGKQGVIADAAAFQRAKQLLSCSEGFEKILSNQDNPHSAPLLSFFSE